MEAQDKTKTVKVPEQTIDVLPAPPSTRDIDLVAVPTTTAEENKHSASQRQINLWWEITQSLLAMMVIGGSIGSAMWLAINDPSARNLAFLFITNIASNVIGFYFGRTNHQRVGGVQTGR